MFTIVRFTSESASMTQLWCNGQWLESGDFPFPPTDRGVTLGLGLFETLLAVDGVPVFADRHLARFKQSCERLGWNASIPDFQKTASELLVRNHLTTGRARVRLAISGGSGPMHDLALGIDHLVSVIALPVGDAPETLTMSLSPWPRNEHSPLAGLKCASYAENVIALSRAQEMGFDETIFFNTAGHLCEAATANVFVIRNSRIYTPPLSSGCLPGITRAVTMELATSLGICCQESHLTSSDVAEAEEIFVTSSLRGLTGVSKFDERMLPSGPVTQRLREAWHATVVSAAKKSVICFSQ